MKSMYSRQFATMAGMILLSFLLLGASFVALSYRHTIREKQEVLGRNASYIASYTSDFVNASEDGAAWMRPAFHTYLSNVALLTDSQIMLATNEGQVLYVTDGTRAIAAFENRMLPGDVVSAITHEA